MHGKLKSVLPFLITGAVFLLYIVLGGVIFHFIEQDNETKVQQETKEFTGIFLGKFSQFFNTWLSVRNFMCKQLKMTKTLI